MGSNSMHKFSKLNRGGHLYEDVMMEIKGAILSGIYPSGSFLSNESELANQFKVSRPVIREALRALQSKGFLHIKRGTKGGIFVNDVSRLPIFDDFESFILHQRVKVDHLAQARLYLEPEICRLAAVNATQEDIKAMGGLISSYENVSADEKDSLFAQFHRLVGRACGNPIYALLMENIMDFTEGFLRTIRPVTTIIHNDRDHDDIIEAIEARDPERAERVAVRHATHILKEMKKLEQVYLELLNK
jgi:DNA-binding FadR family transcriptional regulator